MASQGFNHKMSKITVIMEEICEIIDSQKT